MIKTFRGLLADGGQDRIKLSTIKGKVGYRITKFQVIPFAPGTTDTENVLKIYKTEQTSVGTSTATINFTDTDLLASAWSLNDASGQQGEVIILFDTEIFNQDIYITYTDQRGSSTQCNYYLELEVIPLDDKGAEYTTIKDLRTRGF